MRLSMALSEIQNKLCKNIVAAKIYLGKIHPDHSPFTGTGWFISLVQGGLFQWYPPKSSKCQSVSKKYVKSIETGTTLKSPSTTKYLFFPLGTGGPTKTDEFSEKFQTAYDPPLIFGKSYCGFCDKSA